MTRSVSPRREPERKLEISVIGYLTIAGALFLVLPLLPIIAILWIVDRLWDRNDSESVSE